MRIRSLRRARGISQKVIADYLGCSTVVYSRYETGARAPSIDTLQRLAKYYDVSIDYLVGNSPAPTADGAVRVPVLTALRADIPAAAEDAEDWEEIDAALAKTGEFVALRVRDNAMEPYILEGDIAIIRRQDTVESGQLAAVLVGDGDATIKKVRLMPDGLMLIGFNTAAYEPHPYSGEEAASLPVRIYGRLVEIRRKF